MNEETNSELLQEVRDLDANGFSASAGDGTDGGSMAPGRKPGDTDGTDGDTDGTDGGDSDGTDGDTDGTDGGDSDGTDGDSDGTDNA